MKRITMLVLAFGLFAAGCETSETNPFLTKWDTPFGTPPFEQIKTEHYLPAFEESIEKHNAEIDSIVNNKEEATFENTIAALDNSGVQLDRVRRVFSSMKSSMNNDQMQKISKKVTPMLAKHKDDVNLNEGLFKRVNSVYEKKDDLNLTTEQNKLLDKYYKQFIRGGINLEPELKEEFRKINENLSVLQLQFGENILKETNKFELVIDNKDDLEGLSETQIAGAAETAKEKGYEGKWVFTIHKPSMIPFLQYSTKRDLREKIYKAYFMKGDNDDSFDNKKILAKMAALRVKRANILGYDTHAHYVLEEQMAGSPDNVYDLLNKLWTPALKRAKQERKEMQQIIDSEGGKFKLEPWDWWYYAEKLKKAKYNLDEEELRPYFKVENVIDGVFGLATNLWGITFEKRDDIQKYHPDVNVFEVKEADGSHIGILYTDYFPRPSKRAGAWMDALRKQHKKDGKMISPIIYNVGNFSKPTGDKPALISVDETKTLFHEFGHALHGLLSNCTYVSISGTETPRDFVEFPSQVMENWALHPDVITSYAKHYKTGEPIPDELIEKIQKSSLFNQGFETVEYLAASFLDMDWHTMTEAKEVDARAFENKSMKKIGLMPEILPRYRSTYFNHIFGGDYSSGYYSYIWSEVLDADAFNAFVKSGNVLDKELASKYRKYILASGGTDDSMELYKKFRGQEPTIKPLLAKRGLN
ncbi:MAG: M3 family metallopeptidase [Ignavibacteriae bacterium]|nr:M3 family peptidase [Ignavibacteriota bacterium]NOG99495.1 M3 family metallopeptidase [Ignavibacteriota bacterium]